jgi:hypothetical protein
MSCNKCNLNSFFNIFFKQDVHEDKKYGDLVQENDNFDTKFNDSAQKGDDYRFDELSRDSHTADHKNQFESV